MPKTVHAVALNQGSQIKPQASRKTAVRSAVCLNQDALLQKRLVQKTVEEPNRGKTKIAHDKQNYMNCLNVIEIIQIRHL